MDEFGARIRCRGSQCRFLEEDDAQAPGGGVARYTHPRDTPADDGEIVTNPVPFR